MKKNNNNIVTPNRNKNNVHSLETTKCNKTPQDNTLLRCQIKE